MGLTAVCATELEFYLIDADTEVPAPRVGNVPGTRRTQSGPQYGSMEDVEDADPFLADLFETCKAQNIPAGATLKEFSPGQFEINLHHVANAELAADHGVLLKRAVKAVARKHGMAASFMAKPFAEWAGCSLHVHVSLLDAAGTNIFAGSSRDGPFADTLRHAIGGLAAAMPESMAIFAPTANSYRRYRPGVFVPLEPNWGRNHRGVALRIPMSKPEDARVEHRPGGADGNPYLVIAAILAGMHHGITNKVEPGPMVAQESVIDEKIALPLRWSAALDAFDAGEILPRYLGEKFHRLYGICRREEEERFHSEVSERDYEWYLRAV
jgi:glutamine synthetase